MELSTGYGNRVNHNAKVYVFEDGTYIKATDTKDGIFKYVCVECGKRKLNETQIKKIKKDKLKYEFAKNHNFNIIYIWEEEINNNDFSKLEVLL